MKEIANMFLPIEVFLMVISGGALFLSAPALVGIFSDSPEVIALGGGVSKAGDFLLDKVRALMPELVFFRTMPYARIELARLGNDAGIIGAAALE